MVYVTEFSKSDLFTWAQAHVSERGGTLHSMKVGRQVWKGQIVRFLQLTMGQSFKDYLDIQKYLQSFQRYRSLRASILLTKVIINLC